MNLIIAGNYGAGNLGDELILEGLISILRKDKGFKDITVFSANPKRTKKDHGVNACKHFPAGLHSLISKASKQTKKAVKNSEVFILGGGGLFAGPKFRANIIWGIQALQALRHKKRLWLIGHSVGPLSNPLTRWIVKKIFSRAEFITVRDRASKKRLEEIGIKNINQLPDLAFATKWSPKNRKEYIVVSLRAGAKLPNNFHVEITRFLDWLREHLECPLKFISMQEGRDPTLTNGSMLSPKDHKLLENIYGSAAAVIGMRLHSVVSAIKAEKPFLAISYAPKVKDLLVSKGFAEHTIELKEFNADEAIERWQQLADKQKKLHQLNQQLTAELADLSRILPK